MAMITVCFGMKNSSLGTGFHAATWGRAQGRCQMLSGAHSSARAALVWRVSLAVGTEGTFAFND